MIYTHVAAGLLGAVIAALSVWQVQDWRFNSRIAHMQQAHTVSLKKMSDDALVQQQAALDRLQKLNTAKQKVEEAYADKQRKAAVAARGARAELDGLRNELYALPPPPLRLTPGVPDTPAPRRADVSSIERKLLGECAATLVEVAVGADVVVAQLVGLQSYVRDVCVAPK
jgi:hypothetical protein